MTSLHFGQLLSGHIFAFMLVFARLSAVFLLFPGLGETFVPARFRMMLALAMSFVLTPPLYSIMPPAPDSIPDLGFMVILELVIGFFYGSFLRVAVSTLETAGSIVAIQTGLSNATILNPALASQSPLSSAFLSIIGTTLVFVTDLDHMLIRALIDTYSVFPPGVPLMTGDMAQSFIEVVNRSFVTGIELSAPFLVIGILMFVALGVLQRLLPQVQLFLVVLPIQIWGGLFLLGTTIAGIMTVWLMYFDNVVGQFMVP